MILGLCGLFVVLHVLTSALGEYGYFIDEFYYIACAKRPAAGYVDHPPLAPLLLSAWRSVVGDSLIALRLPAFLAGAASLYATGRIVTDLGGRTWAVVLAVLALAVAPGFLAVTGFFSVNAFELLFWTLCTWTFVRLLRTQDPRWWLAFGLFAGLSFESKHTVLSFLLAMGVGVLFTGARRLVWNRWMLFGAGIAALLAVPNLAWQIANGWPSLEFYREAQLRKNLPSPPLQTLARQLLFMGPLAAALWLSGLGFFLADADGRRWRGLGIAYIVLLGMLVLSQQSRPDRLLGIYPAMFAGGAVVFERWLTSGPWRIAVTASIVAASLVFSPLVLPLLPPERLAGFVTLTGAPTTAERGKTSAIPQLLADRTGWESFVDDVARIYQALPERDRRRVVVYGPSYGHAGAIELLGPRRGMVVRTISNHNNYYHWSQGVNPEVVIAVGADPSGLRQLFAQVEAVGVSRCEYCMSWRDNNPIFLARDPIRPLDDVWAGLKHYE